MKPGNHLIAAALAACLAACSAPALPGAFADDAPVIARAVSSIETVLSAVAQGADDLQGAGESGTDPGYSRPASFEPLQWDVAGARLVGRQGSAGLWGTCGECAIANTLNLACGSALTEAEVTASVLERGLCDPETGGMTLDDMADAYSALLPDGLDAHGYGGDYAPTPDEMADLLDSGILLNASVYGEMMREGGHAGEGEVTGTHWLVLHRADRAPDGTVEGFGIVDSASDATHLTAQELADVYYGRDGTVITDPCCIEVYGRKPA